MPRYSVCMDVALVTFIPLNRALVIAVANITRKTPNPTARIRVLVIRPSPVRSVNSTRQTTHLTVFTKQMGATRFLSLHSEFSFVTPSTRRQVFCHVDPQSPDVIRRHDTAPRVWGDPTFLAVRPSS